MDRIEVAQMESPALMGGLSDLQQLAVSLFETLRDQSFDGVGISRETYGAAETAAIELIERMARKHGLSTARDAASNLIIRLPGRDPTLPVVATGSHLDSVPQGGNFDGAAGVIASLLGMIDAARRGPTLRNMELYVLRGEESAWYGGPCYFGSRALFGQLTDTDFKSMHRSSGRSLEDHMVACGANLALLKDGKPLADQSRIG